MNFATQVFWFLVILATIAGLLWLHGKTSGR